MLRARSGASDRPCFARGRGRAIGSSAVNHNAVMPMDHLERMFRHLVRTIETSFPMYLSRPFEVGELYQTILPYRHHRRELGFGTNQDYEMALTELLSGTGGYLIVDDRMADLLRRELESTNPDPGAFREFATSQVALSPEALRRVQGGAEPAAATPAERAADAGTPVEAPPAFVRSPQRESAPAAPPAMPPSPPRPSTSVGGTPPAGARHTPPVAVNPGDSCRYCGGALPVGRRILFCPHCGQNLTVQHCAACGTELEVGWKFCVTCGRASD